MSNSSAWRWLWLLAGGSIGCSSPDGATTFRPDAQFAFVMYLDGPSDALTRVDLDLDTGEYGVGTGESGALSVRSATVTADELTEGRELFEEEQIAAYRQASLAIDGSEDPEGETPIRVTILVPPGTFNRTSLRFAKTEAHGRPVSDMIDYFAELAALPVETD